MRSQIVLLLVFVAAAGIALVLELVDPPVDSNAAVPESSESSGGLASELTGEAPSELPVTGGEDAAETSSAADPGGRVAQSASDVPGAPLNIRLLREGTGEPLPHFHLEVRRGGRPHEQLASDAEGYVAGTVLHPPGTLLLRLLDHPSHPSPTRHSHEHLAPDAPSIVDVVVEAGSTLRLAPELPPGVSLSRFEAFATRGSRSRAISRLQRGSAQRSRLRSGDPAWVRLYRESSRARDADWLVVCDTRGEWLAIAPFDAEQPIQLEFERWVSVDLRFELEDGRLPFDLRVEASFPGTNEHTRRVHVGSDGECRLPFLANEKRTCELLWTPQRYEPTGISFEVEPGQEQRRVVRLREAEVSGDVRGTLRSETGTNRHPKKIELRSQGEGGLRSLEVEVEWEQRLDGTWTGRFAAESVPEGTYVLRPDPVDYDWGLHAWSPEEIEFEAPAEDLAFLLLDGPRTYDVSVRVTDMETGMRIDAFWLVAGEGRVIEGRSGVPVLWDQPDSEGLTCAVYAPGYRFNYFDEGNVEPDPDNPALDARVVNLGLEPGWQTNLRTFGVAGKDTERRTYVQEGDQLVATDGWTWKRLNAGLRPPSVTIERDGYHTLVLELPAAVSHEPWTKELEHGRVEVSAFELSIDAFPDPLEEEDR